MKLLFKYLFVLSITMYYGCSTKKTIDKDRQRINRVCDDIMDHFKSSEFVEMSKLLKANSSLIGKSEFDTLQKQMIDQHNAGLFSQYGKVTSYELVKEVSINSFAAKRIYALRCEHFFFTTTLSLYNSVKGWEITGFKYDEDNSAIY